MAWLAAGLVFAAFFMKTIGPLRSLAIAGNLAFIVYGLLGVHYGIFDKVLPILVLQCALLPLNVLRLREVTANIRAIRSMQSAVSAPDFLIPYMSAMQCAAGSVVFRKGDAASGVYLLKRGRLRLVEFDTLLPEGELFGGRHLLRRCPAHCHSGLRAVRDRHEGIGRGRRVGLSCQRALTGTTKCRFSILHIDRSMFKMPGCLTASCNP